MVEEIQLSIQRLPGTEDLPLPSYMTEQAAGMDLFAAVAEDAAILPGERKLVPTGVVVALPEGYEAEVRPRSGLALKHGVTLANAPGTIDAVGCEEIRSLAARMFRHETLTVAALGPVSEKDLPF